MGLQTYIIGGIAIFATGLMSLIFMPVMQRLAYDIPYWNTAPAEQLVIRDAIYDNFHILPFMVMGAIILWMYLNSGRQAQQDSYY